MNEYYLSITKPTPDDSSVSTYSTKTRLPARAIQTVLPLYNPLSLTLLFYGHKDYSEV